MRIPFWAAAFLGILAVGVMGGYYLALYLQKQFEAILAGVALLAFLTWLGSGADLLGLLREWYKETKEKEKSRKAKLRIHTKNLNQEVYKLLLHIFVRQDYKNKIDVYKVPKNLDEVVQYQHSFDFLLKHEDPDLIPLDKIPYLERGISHLRHPSYSKIYNEWEKMQKVLHEYNDAVQALENALDSAIRASMREILPSFSDPDSTVQTSQNFYYTKRLSGLIKEHVSDSISNNRSPSFPNLKKWKGNFGWVISVYDTDVLASCQSETDADPERFKQVLLLIANDNTIVSGIRRVNELVEDRLISISNFEAYLKELVEDIDDIEDDYLIEGKCERCPKD